MIKIMSWCSAVSSFPDLEKFLNYCFGSVDHQLLFFLLLSFWLGLDPLVKLEVLGRLRDPTSMVSR